MTLMSIGVNILLDYKSYYDRVQWCHTLPIKSLETFDLKVYE